MPLVTTRHGQARALAPALHDLDVRKKIVDGHKDYAQILSYSQPAIEDIAKTPAQINEFCRMINDGFAELCAKEADHFPGWSRRFHLMRLIAASARQSAPSKTWSTRRADIHQRGGKPLDRPQYLPFWNRMNELGTPIWMHPIRGANMPDYIDEKSLYEIWWTFGWSSRPRPRWRGWYSQRSSTAIPT